MVTLDESYTCIELRRVPIVPLRALQAFRHSTYKYNCDDEFYIFVIMKYLAINEIVVES